ncbi:hypothetical protein AB4Y32_32265 [Paraburkholderia phymatum]|uniref:Uncharacterized protein n=1 Tax=Paraburkholderia phymatum TaxID=148447 RepID=A0ACC6U9Q2_9BURK
MKAIDIRTGEMVWSDVLPGGGQPTPMVYEQYGKAYLVTHAKTPSSPWRLFFDREVSRAAP